jgi:hypothetical protein
MTLDELETLVREAVHPRDLFGDDVAGRLESFRALCRPDRNPGQERRARAILDALEQFARFSPEDVAAVARAEAVYRSLAPPDERAASPTEVIASAAREYALVERLAVGDVSDVYLARSRGVLYVLKVARDLEGADLLEVERAAVAALLAEAGETHYRAYFPPLVESFPVPTGFPKRVNVFLHEPGFSTLEEVHRCHPALDGRHLAWIFKRLLTALGFAHRCGRVHGAVVPSHVLVHADGHGLRLVGWGHSVEVGRPLRTGSAAYLDWYPAEVRRREPAGPATDIGLAARCVAYLAGGDPTTGRMPESVPRAIGAFVRSCLLEGPRMRPDDAWDLLDEFDELLHDLYGPPAYHRLEMPQGG